MPQVKENVENLVKTKKNLHCGSSGSLNLER